MKNIFLVSSGAEAAGMKRCDPSINPATNGLILEWTEVKPNDKKDPYANQGMGWNNERKMKIFKLSESDACMKEFIEIAKEDGMEMDSEGEPSVPEDKKKAPTVNSKPTMVKKDDKPEEGSDAEEAEETPDEEEEEDKEA